MPKDSIVILPQNGYTGVDLTFFPPFRGFPGLSKLLAIGLAKSGGTKS